MPVDILLLPVSGPVGYGEFARCKMVAQASLEHWPQLALKLAVSREASYVEDTDLSIALLSASPTSDVEGVAALLTELRPRLAIFDNGGRSSLLRLAREQGIRTAFISSRLSSRRRAFSIRRMHYLDEAWLIGDPVSQPRSLSRYERLARKIVPTTQHRFMGPVFPTPQAAPNPAAELVGEDYALFVPGGGATGGSDVGALYLAAADQYSRATGQRAVVITGPGSNVPTREHVLPVIRQLPPQAFVNSLAGCSLAVTGGGSLIGQALALNRPLVAAPLGGSDQQLRVRDLAAAGVLLAASAQPDELAAQAIRMHRDGDLAAGCAKARQALQIEPGLPRMLDHIAELLGLPL